ncbi:MAG TPA: hypothetical protein VFN95_07460 [Flavitalea sp.]|nr:hypothetical protein [Flavitalea sp.]
MKSVTSVLAGCFIVSTLLVTSCKKENSVQSPTVTAEESQTISEENAAADAEFDEVTEIAMTADADLEIAASEQNETNTDGAGIRIRTHIFRELAFRLGPCTEITVSGETFPKTVTINYGDGCMCRDGKFRKGAVILHFTAPLRRPGSVLTVTLRDYFVNRVHIEGIKTITNLSAAGAIKYSVKIEEGRITWPNGRGFTYVGSKTVSQISGMNTSTITDDIYEIHSRNQTFYANGLVVVKNTETPLIKKISCQWLVQGILKIKINERTLFINYGNGDCDNKAIVSWAGGEKEITLH